MSQEEEGLCLLDGTQHKREASSAKWFGIAGVLVVALVVGIVAVFELRPPNQPSTQHLTVASQNLVWPLPQLVELGSGSVPISPLLTFTSSGSSDVVTFAISQYKPIILRSAIGGVSQIQSVQISFEIDDSKVLGPDTNYSYAIHLAQGDSTVFISARGVFGVRYALETLSQLVVAGTLRADSIHIVDDASYQHRGLGFDSGRRFHSIRLLQSMVDAMSFSKLNVLHLHASDWAAVRIESLNFPELTAGLKGQFYSQDDMRGLVEYCRLRGVRVMVELDIPSHASGFAPLQKYGLKFCKSDTIAAELYHDPSNGTLSVLKALLTEFVSFLPEPLFHIGADETGALGNCTTATVGALETALQQHLLTLNKIPVGWHEMEFFSQAALPNSILENWKGVQLPPSFKQIAAPNAFFYLDKATPFPAMYRDIKDATAPIIGGEAVMWSDEYCYTLQCGSVQSTVKPSAWWMALPEYDAEFELSISQVVWPRAAVAAGSFWNFDPTVNATSPAFQATVAAHANRLRQRGIDVCYFEADDFCVCTQSSGCTPYPVPN